MKEWLINAIQNIPQSTKDRLIKSFIYTIGVISVMGIALAILEISPIAFFVSLIFGVVWAWIFSNTKDRGNNE